MLKIVKYSVILLFLAINYNLFAQSKIENINISDSAAIEGTTYRLKLNPLLNSPKLFLGQKDFEIRSDEYFSSQNVVVNENSPQSIEDLKLQLKDYLSQRRNLLPNYDLGDFGKYLGYANAFAAVLLAIAHISKYGFK